MTYLLDTRTWLWMAAAPERLAESIRTLVTDTRNTLLLSAASSWEIAIKYALGRLSLPEAPASYVPDRMRRTGVEGLVVTHNHALHVAGLEPHHRDPFDRLLIAQAMAEAIPIITTDTVFTRYDVEVIPAAG